MSLKIGKTIQNPKKIIAHCLVKNEERWIWFAINSVIDYLDEILIWDTGSTDQTVEFIHSIKNPKLIFKEIGPVDSDGLTTARNDMLKASKGFDWLFILDGDEVWPKKAIQETVNLINHHQKLDVVVSPFINLVGDIYHKLPDKTGHYNVHDREGNYNIRLINSKIQGLKVIGPHGRQTYVNDQLTPLQEFPKEKIVFAKNPYWHMSHLQRSSSRNLDKEVPKRAFKYKIELGEPTMGKYIPPEVFSKKRPKNIPDPWKKMSSGFRLKSHALTPLKNIKRLLSKTTRIGY